MLRTRYIVYFVRYGTYLVRQCEGANINDYNNNKQRKKKYKTKTIIDEDKTKPYISDKHLRQVKVGIRYRLLHA